MRKSAAAAGGVDVSNTPAIEVQGSRVGVIGGSIAGCALAIALDRLGCDVTILERSSSGLHDRGSGIAIPPPLRDELVTAGYLPSDYPVWRGGGRRWYVADGTDGGDLRWSQPGELLANNWSTLWRGLRSNVSSDVEYIDGAQVEKVIDGVDGATITCADGSVHNFDIVFGADGYRSLVRALLHPGSEPRFAGYILWRGNFAASELTDTAVWNEVLESEEWLSVGFSGGHGVMYPIPDFEAAGAGELRVNWAIYAPTPAALELAGPSSIPPGEVDEACYAEYRRLLDDAFPKAMHPVFTSSRDTVSIQPVYDELIDSYAQGRLALIGDAATLARPHTGSGATKAMQDARLIETLGETHLSLDALLDAYDADRTATCTAMVELGRRIGRDQVEQTPLWSTMTPDDFEAWTAGTLAGDAPLLLG